jgi:hypothetical protein
MYQNENIAQAITEYTKWPNHLPNFYKIYRMEFEYTTFFHSKAFPNVPKLLIFGLKIYHLATLLLIWTAEGPTSISPKYKDSSKDYGKADLVGFSNAREKLA